MLDDPHWVEDSLRYLPEDFRFHGSLFLTFGYDIGVAMGPTASLNCAHPHFKGHPPELIYYAIHELHHVGFMTYQPPPKLSELKTCADLLRLVKYSTQLEGMGVLAAYQRRREGHTLADDGDYVALEDEPRMQRDETLYFEDLHYLERRATQPADAAAWAVIERMSSAERLWYRVGARMARRIEKGVGPGRARRTRQAGPRQLPRGLSGGQSWNTQTLASLTSVGERARAANHKQCTFSDSAKRGWSPLADSSWLGRRLPFSPCLP